MVEEISHDRRRFLATAIMTIASAELGMIGSAAAQSSKAKPATVPAIKSLKQIDAGLLNVGYAETGPSGGTPVILLHGWPLRHSQLCGRCSSARVERLQGDCSVCAWLWNDAFSFE